MSPDPRKVPNSPIAVVGVGCRFPNALDADAFWSLIERGQVTFREIPPERWHHDVFFSANQRDVDKSWVASGSFIEEFREFAALHYGIAPRRLEVMDPQQRLLIESTRWALQDAGYERRRFDRRRTGVFFGVSVSEFKNIAQSRVHAMQLLGGDFGAPAGDQVLRRAVLDMAANVAPMRAFTLSGSLTALAAATVAQTFDLGGPAYVIDSACASASVAVNDAMLHLRAGLLDHAVAGGAYLNLSPDNLVAFTKIGAISPDGVCRPFDHRSNGFVQSDGVGVLVLRRLEDALRDGDRIHAVLIGTGCNNDGRGEGPMTPRFEGQLEVLQAAYADAEISASTVAYFEAHGTATSVGDPVEVRALGTLLEEAGRERDGPAWIGSVKGNIGHAMSAAGIAGLIKAIKVLEHRVSPPQPSFEKVHPKLGLERYPLRVAAERAPLAPVSSGPLRVAVSSFGFGGTNSHLVLEAPPVIERPARMAESIELCLERGAQAAAVEPEALLITAPTLELLAGHLDTLESYLSEGPGRRASLADLAYTLNVRRERERYRAVVGARTTIELFRNLRAARAALEGEPKLPLVVSPHVSVHDTGFGEDRPTPKLAFLFPGQGAQRTGLLEGIRQRFPIFRQAFERLEGRVEDLLPKPLSSYLYPTERDDAAEAELTQTEICQPAMVALGLATAELLARAGVKAHTSLGHSLGEFAALAHAAAIDPADAVRLVAERGAAMRGLALEDPGAMAAVMADEQLTREVVADIDGVVVANVNHPRQVAISGTTAAVALASSRLEARGIDVRQLDVSHAFHSPVLRGIDEKVGGLLAGLSIQAPRHIVASCVSGEVYTSDVDRIRAVLTQHATSPVDFVRGLGQTREAGATVYLQVGAGSTLAGFVRATLGKETVTLTVAPATEDRGYELIRTLCTLAALGVEVDFEPLYAGDGRRVMTLPETPLERQSYWVVKPSPQPVAELTHPLPGPGQAAVRMKTPSTGHGQDLSAHSEGPNGRPHTGPDGPPLEISVSETDAPAIAWSPASSLPPLVDEREAQAVDPRVAQAVDGEAEGEASVRRPAGRAERAAAPSRARSPSAGAAGDPDLIALAAAPSRARSPSAGAAGDPDLIALFARQAEVLKAHADILAAQNRLLLGAVEHRGTLDALSSSERPAFLSLGAAREALDNPPEPTEGGELEERRSVLEAKTRGGQPDSRDAREGSSAQGAKSRLDPRPEASELPRSLDRREGSSGREGGADAGEIRSRVLDIISKVSAFPKDSLRSDQRLIDELGFDSLMVADLGGALEAAFPGAGRLPPTLFSLSTTVADVADHLASSLTSAVRAEPEPAVGTPAKAPADSAPESSPKRPARRYRVVPRARSRAPGAPHDLAGETWLLTEDDSKLSAEVGAALADRGARLVRVRFVEEGVAAPARLAFGTINIWSAAYAEGLPEALDAAGIRLDGFLHAAGIAPAASDRGAPAQPLALLHPLAAALDVSRSIVVTTLGGKLGLERSPTLTRNVLQAASIGYTKALARERPHRVIRALDVDPRVDPKRNAQWIVEEMLSPDLALEVGFTGGQRVVPELEPIEPKQLTGRARALGPQDVVLITGGTGELGARVADWVAEQRPKGVIIAGRRPADEAINAQLARLSAKASTAAYVSVDLTRPESLESSTRLFVDRVGQVTVVIHAAGIIEDAPASSKTVESIEGVMATKVRGVQAILQSFPEVRDLVFFSSWAGRFGNAGQVDYSAANDLLDRLAVTGSGSTRTVSIEWPPWDGTRMVASIPAPTRTAMEARGVTFLQPDEGLALLEEIFGEDSRGIELVGRDLPAREVRMRARERFGLDRHPYLTDHRLNGRPVVPLASITDWVAEAFRGSTGVEGPIQVEGLGLVRGVMGDETAELSLEGRCLVDGGAEADIQIRAGRDGALAYRARVRAASPGEGLLPIELAGQPRTAPLGLDAFYERHTFHGPQLRGLKRLNRSTAEGISGIVRASDIGAWLPESGRQAWLLDPLVLDGSFQLAGYWLHVHHGRAGFPVGFDRLTLVRPFGREGVHCVVRLREVTAEGFAGDIFYADAEGRPYAMLENVRGHFADLSPSGDDHAPSPSRSSSGVNGTSASPGAPSPSSDGSMADGRRSSSPPEVAALSREPGLVAEGSPRRHALDDQEPTAGPQNGAPLVEVPEETFDVARFPEVEALSQRFEMARLMGLHNPYFSLHAGTARDTSVVEGRELIHFSGYNYLGFSGRAEVTEAAKAAAERYGTSVSASRVASGERPIHREFEQGIADHLGVEDAILYVGGHTTNVTTVGHLLGKEDLVVHDALIHDSVFQGIRLSGAARRPFAHNDMGALERILAQVRTSFRRVLLCAEGIYSMDGDICDLPRLIELKKKYRCLLLVDEAHSIGVLGPQGRGVGHHFPGIDPNDVDMWMGTLSKSFASVGGYIAGRRALVEYLKYTAPGFVYSVGLAPPNAAAALASLRLMQAEPEVVERLRSNSRFFLEECQSQGLDTGPAVGAAVVPVIVGDSVLCMRLSAALAERGINVQPIVYPAVENESARLRFFVSALHSEEQLRYAARATREALDELRGISGGGPEARV